MGLIKMGYYRQHVFFCTNLRDGERQSCQQCDAQAARDYVKQRCKTLGLSQGAGSVRINTAGCLDRCEAGPVMVVYPEGVWYTYVDREDLDEIIEQHLQGGQVVERLLIQ
jgi:(2Fe-2S) ferredoxin